MVPDDIMPAVIDLAHEPRFHLGALDVRPAHREVRGGQGVERLEPRVMQVLVSLARQAGEVVSRDDLIAACWAGRIVGDDAINRCISQVRRIGLAHGDFEVETIPRVGYRLVADATRSDGATSDEVARVLLAVLPFENLSGDPAMVYFSDGVSEEILHAVARSTDLRVVGRSSSFSFRGADKSIPNVARELGSTHVLDGSVRRNTSRVRVSVQLIECSSQTSIWTDQFDRDLSDVLALQDDVAAAVASALKARLIRQPGSEKVDPVAYDLYLRSYPGPDRGVVPTAEAIGMLERAVALAPQFASAWAELAFHRVSAFRRLSLDPDVPEVSREKVLETAGKALELDPDSAVVQVVFHHLLPWGDYLGREAALGRAALAGGAAEASVELGWFLSAVGRNDEALGHATRALALDPFNARVANVHAQLLCAVGRYDDSIRAFAAYRARWPHLMVFVNAPLLQAAAVHDWDECERLRRIGEAEHADQMHVRGALRRVATMRDPTPDRRARILRRMQDQVREQGRLGLDWLILAYHTGLADEAFRLVEEADFATLRSEHHLSPAGFLSPGLIFDRSGNLEMMHDPRFAPVCAKLGLRDYWREAGIAPDCAAFVTYDLMGPAHEAAHRDA